MPIYRGIAALSRTFVTKSSVVVQYEAVIKTGTVAVANNVLPPGLRIQSAFTCTQAVLRVGTAPTGAGLTVAFKKNGVQFTTVTIPAGIASGSVTGLSEGFVAGDVLTWDVTGVGSTVAGSDLAAAIVGAP